MVKKKIHIKMILSERVKKLRSESLNAPETISAERARLITSFTEVAMHGNCQLL